MCIPVTAKPTIRILTILTLFACLTAMVSAQTPSIKNDTWRGDSGQVKLLWRKNSKNETDYTRSTVSFEYGTRDDMKLVGNDWDLYLDGQGVKKNPYTLMVRTVTDDKSEFWDLGKVDFAKVSKNSAKARTAKKCPHDDTGLGMGLAPVIGHSYLVHTVDSNSDFWSKLTVEKVVARDSVTISWQVLTKPQRKLEAHRLERAKQAKALEKAKAKRRKKKSR